MSLAPEKDDKMGNREELLKALDGLSGEKFALAESWIRMLARKPGEPRIRSSAGPLTDMLHIHRISSENGRATFELTVNPEILNPNGVLAGPAVYAMVDYSMGAATASLLTEGRYCATIEIKISYMASVRTGVVRCETEVVRPGRRVMFLESKVRDDSAKLIAAATGSFMVIEAPA